MVRSVTSLAAMPDELGIELAARLAGIPVVTLRYHVDRGRVMGVRRTPSGHRRITREGLLAYLKARGIEPRHAGHLERRGGGRASTTGWTRILIRLADPRDSSHVLGQGEGILADLSASGLRAKKLSWTGCLPGPGMEMVFVVLVGELQSTRGTATLNWIVWRGEEFQMGLGLTRLEGRGTRVLWERTIKAGLEARQRAADALYAQATKEA